MKEATRTTDETNTLTYYTVTNKKDYIAHSGIIPCGISDETNTLTYYIFTNKKDNIADSGIISCGISDHDLVYIIRYARLPKIKKDPKIVYSQKHQKLK